MKLETVTIRAARRYDKWTGYRGEVTFDGPLGKVQVQTTEDLSRRILEACADELVAASRQVAEQLTANIIETVAPKAVGGPAE